MMASRTKKNPDEYWTIKNPDGSVSFIKSGYDAGWNDNLKKYVSVPKRPKREELSINGGTGLDEGSWQPKA